MQQPQFVLYPRYWQRFNGDNFKRHDIRPWHLSQAELEMICYLSNTKPWSDGLIRSEIHWNGQLKPIKARSFSVDFASIDQRQIFELDGYVIQSVANPYTSFSCHVHCHDVWDCPDFLTYWQHKDYQATKKTQLQRDQLITKMGWSIQHIPSCLWSQWKQGKNTHNMGLLAGHAGDIAEFLAKHVNFSALHPPEMSEEQLKQSICDGSIEGIVACEFKPKDETIRQKWLAYPPIFTRNNVSPDMLGAWTEALCKKWGLSNKAVSQLLNVTETKGTQLFDTRFCKWIMSQGYIMYNIHYVCQWKCSAIFNEMIEKIVALRKYGDTDEVLKCIGEIAKLLLNAAYGKMLGRYINYMYTYRM